MRVSHPLSLPPTAFNDNHISHQHFFLLFFLSASHYVACLSSTDLLACPSSSELASVWLVLPVLSDIELITSSNEGLLLGWTWHLRRVVGEKTNKWKNFISTKWQLAFIWLSRSDWTSLSVVCLEHNELCTHFPLLLTQAVPDSS